MKTLFAIMFLTLAFPLTYVYYDGNRFLLGLRLNGWNIHCSVYRIIDYFSTKVMGIMISKGHHTR